MKIHCWLAVVTFACSTAAAGAGDDVVPPTSTSGAFAAEAIAASGASRGCYPITAGGIFAEGAIGCLSTPYSRIVAAARLAAAKYRPFSEADATAEIVAPGEIRIHGFSRAPKKGPPASVVAIAIMPRGEKNRAKAVQPIRTEEMTDEYKNLFGAVFQGKSMTAAFPLSALADGNEIHVVYDRWLFGCDDCTIPFHMRDFINKGMTRAEVEALAGPPGSLANMRTAKGEPMADRPDYGLYRGLLVRFKDGKVASIEN